jgi:hypothetical protein
VQIEKKHCSSTLPAFTAMRPDTTVAHDHASLFPTQMALARWTRGGDIPHVHAAEQNMPMRSAWYAQAQQRFQDWLDAGGFHRADNAIDGADMHGECAASPFPVPGIASRPAPAGQR